MSYLTKTEQIRIGVRDYQICSLADMSQCPDDIASGESDSNTGITETNWPLFGQLWAAGCVLAETIDKMNLRGLRILEVGCGLAISGIVAHGKGMDVTVSDFHPAAGEFLARNIAINGMSPLKYVEANWSKTYDDLGTFDLILGGDVLYDRDHPLLLATFLKRHLKPRAQVLITDPGRQNYRHFSKEMETQGFTCTSSRKKLERPGADQTQYHLLDYRR